MQTERYTLLNVEQLGLYIFFHIKSLWPGCGFGTSTLQPIPFNSMAGLYSNYAHSYNNPNAFKAVVSMQILSRQEKSFNLLY